jgi:hypothetical protein
MLVTVIVSVCSVFGLTVLVIVADDRASRRRRERLGPHATSVWQLQYDLAQERATEHGTRGR